MRRLLPLGLWRASSGVKASPRTPAKTRLRSISVSPIPPTPAVEAQNLQRTNRSRRCQAASDVVWRQAHQGDAGMPNPPIIAAWP